MFPLLTVAASLVPSLEEVMPIQVCEVARETQFAPESVEVQMFRPLTTAASLVPSLEEVMPRQLCEVAREVQVEEAFVGAIAISVKNKVRNKRYRFISVSDFNCVAEESDMLRLWVLGCPATRDQTDRRRMSAVHAR